MLEQENQHLPQGWPEFQRAIKAKKSHVLRLDEQMNLLTWNNHGASILAVNVGQVGRLNEGSTVLLSLLTRKARFLQRYASIHYGADAQGSLYVSSVVQPTFSDTQFLEIIQRLKKAATA